MTIRSAIYRSTTELYKPTGNAGNCTRVFSATTKYTNYCMTFPYKKILTFLYGFLDQKGFDPSTLRLQSVHSTDWATSPLMLFSLF